MSPQLRPVTDPDLLEQLEAPAGPPPSPMFSGDVDPGLRTSFRPEPFRELRQLLKTEALPTLGAGAGAVGGFLAGGPGGAKVLESAGGMLGEGLNQEFGITPRSPTRIAAQGAAPPLTRGLAHILGLVPRFGRAAQEFAAEQMKALPGLLRRGDESALYAAARAGNPDIDIAPFTGEADRLFTQATDPLTKSEVFETMDDAMLQKLDQIRMLGQQGPTPSGAPIGTYPWRKFEQEGIGMNELYPKYESGGGQGLGALKRLKGAYEDTLDQAAAAGTTPEVGFLRQARTAHQQNLAAQALEEQMPSLVKYQAGTDLPYTNPEGLRKFVEGNAARGGIFERLPAEADTLTRQAHRLNELPRLPTAPGVNAGSMRLLERASGFGAAGAFLGPQMGLDAATGGFLGAAAGGVAGRVFENLEPGVRQAALALYRRGVPPDVVANWIAGQAGRVGVNTAGGFLRQGPSR